MADMSLVRRLFRHSETIGSDRYRFPVKRNRALATAGAMTGTGGSPQPVGASVPGAACANRESRRRRAWNLLLRTSRDDRTPLELFLASVRGWDGSMRRRFAGCNLQSH